jgi:uncharacterized membrane protein YeaQ/YmgE (transglycosylase-associated protein family)
MPFAILIILAIIGLFVILPTIGSLFNLVIILAVWAIIGWAAGKFLRGRGYGTLGNILLGLAGGLVGGMVFGIFLPGMDNGLIGNLISGVVGAVLVIYIMRLLGNRNFGR